MEDNSGLYIIYNTVNGKMYVGISTNIRKRWNTHKSAARHDLKRKYPIHKAIYKYGEHSFIFKKIEIIHDKNLMKLKEIEYIKFLKDFGYILYNINPGGDLREISPEEKIILSERMSGENNYFYGKKLSGIANGHFGKQMQQHVKDILAKHNRKITKEDVNKIRELYNSGTKQLELSKIYNLNLTTIHNIVMNERWIDPNLPTRIRKPQLKYEDAQEIRKLYTTKNYTYTQLCVIFKISIAQISRIINNKKWKTRE